MRIRSGSRFAAALLTAIVAVGGLTAAALAHAQSGHHHPSAGASTGAQAHHGAKPDGTAKGPDATGPAAFGLCNAWAHNHTHRPATSKSVAFRNLATAAGGADHIAAYCATIPHPGQAHHPKAKPGSRAQDDGR